MSRLLLWTVALILAVNSPWCEAAQKPRARKASPAHRRAAPPTWTADAVNNPDLANPVGPRASGAAALRAQILLSRAHFSVGEIDGSYGENMKKALMAYQTANDLEPSGTVDAATWKALNADTAPALVPYTISEQDINTPFVEVPKEMADQAKLPALGYRNMAEMLGERFHCSPALLEKLNPGKNLEQPGTELLAPSVTGPAPFPKAASVTVSKETRLVQALDANQKLVAVFPATIGSEHDPLPVGDWKVTVVQKNPPFYYNPALFWDAKPGDSKAKLPPGPNGPVGVVWIGLSKEHYGLHGTPEPGTIGHTESHGCIRLTNWDAMTLADMVKVGVPVHLSE